MHGDLDAVAEVVYKCRGSVGLLAALDQGAHPCWCRRHLSGPVTRSRRASSTRPYSWIVLHLSGAAMRLQVGLIGQPNGPARFWSVWHLLAGSSDHITNTGLRFLLPDV